MTVRYLLSAIREVFMAFLELTNVRKVFGQIPAVEDFNLQVQRGELVSFLGPSGCGKTTTLRMIAGFELPTSGAIRLNGADITFRPPNQRNVGMVFQSYALFPNMNIAENIGFGLKLKKRSPEAIRKRVGELLALIHLPDKGRSYPYQLSGGQQQRVALARALAIEPQVLLLDEPLSALDAKIRDELRSEIRRIQQQLGITTVYVTHDQEEALTLSDRVVVMSRGLMEQVGTPLEIYEEPNSRFVADFIGETNFIPGSVRAVNGQHAEFEADGLRMVASTAPGVSTGSAATLTVRPERVRITPQKPDDTPNVFPGEIYETVYMGVDTRYRVKVTPTLSLSVRQQNTSPLGLPSLAGPKGIQVWVSWPPESARVLIG
jgi:putative spermidine/putrescine transport system ATP-binding protein